MAKRWAIVGGGMLGATFALRLAQRRNEVTLYESAKSLGGLTSQLKHEEISWDHFYHVIEDSDRDLLDLLDELGLESNVVWKTTRTRFFDGQNSYDLNNAIDYFLLPALSLLDKIRIAITILRGASISDNRKLEQLNQSEWLLTWSGKSAFENLWRPLLRGRLGDNYKRVSAAFIWSVIHRFYGARRGANKTEQFGYVEGGYARILAALETHLQSNRVNIKTASKVKTIRKINSGLLVDDGTQPAEFDGVIVTTPSPIAAKICDEISEKERHSHSQVAYQGVVCVSALLRRPLLNAYLTYITDESIPFTTVIEMSSLVDRRCYRDNHLVYLPKYLPSDDPLFDASDEEIKISFFAGLQRLVSDFADHDVIVSFVSRSRHVQVLPTIGYSNTMPSIVTSQDNLFICNSAQIINASLSVNEAVALANRTSPDIMGRYTENG